ncbi:MAG: cell wall-binding repeat-containing protein [Rhodoglobus sp.]
MINQPKTASGILMRWSAAVTGLVLAFASSTVAQAAPMAPAVLVGPETVVSLSFDDGNANQTVAASILDASGLKGTFYVPTGWVGQPGYLSRANLTDMAASGHEIGGHTVTHPDLVNVSAAEATSQICQGRATLASWGFNAVTSFAYPFASVNSAVETMVQNCGFNSARGLGDIQTRFGCAGCAFAESMPPSDPYYIKAPDQVDSSWTLADLQSTVTNAENNGGGWVELTFHHVCDGCDPTNSLSITPALFTQFTTWLADRGTTNNTVVKTVGAVVGGAVAPIVGSNNAAAPGPGVNGVVNPSLETAGTGGFPQCWAQGGFGTNTATFSTVTAARTGTAAEQLVVSGLSSGDAKLILTQDLSTCAPTVTPGHTYSLRAWYMSNVTTQFDVYLRDSNGSWTYWTSSPYFAASPIYTQATFTTAVIPAGITGISFGLNLFQNGQLTTDDYALYDTVGAPPILGDLVTATPTITGTSKVGQVLTAVPGAWGPSPVAFTYQWLSGGVAVAGATAATYTQVAADLGKTMTVSVTGTKEGYSPATKTSAATAAVVAGDLTTAVPTISGTAKIGELLTAVPGAWGPTPVTFTYQWLRAGVAISGATAVTYGPVAADFGKTLTVKVTGSKDGYVSATTTSSPTAAVTKGTISATRLAGADRFATAVAISQAYAPGVSRVYIANGYGFPDALSAGPAATHFKSPVLLTQQDKLPASVVAEIRRLNPGKVIVVGGTPSVSDAVLAQLNAIAPTTRISGPDRYATSRAIALDAFGAAGAATAYIATGANFPDALAAGPAAGQFDGPVILVPGNDSTIDTATANLLTSLHVTNVKIAGSSVTVSTGIENALKVHYTVKRIAGSDRYATAVAINTDGFTSSSTAYFAVGTGFVDAVAGGALAGWKGAPLYVTQPNCVPRDVLNSINAMGVTKVVLFGGPSTLSENVLALTPCA